jgi:hypothetical protein
MLAIPARVVHNWDFTPRSVSRKSFALLSMLAGALCIDLPVSVIHSKIIFFSHDIVYRSNGVLKHNIYIYTYFLSPILCVISQRCSPWQPKSKLLNHVEELKEFSRLREQLGSMHIFISTCRFAKYAYLCPCLSLFFFFSLLLSLCAICWFVFVGLLGEPGIGGIGARPLPHHLLQTILMIQNFYSCHRSHQARGNVHEPAVFHAGISVRL